MDDDLSMVRTVRVCVFPDRLDTLLLHVREDATEPLVLPVLPVPFTKVGVARALGDAGIRATVFESIPGRWSTAMTAARAAEAGERGMVERNKAALSAAVLRGSVDPAERDRAKLVQQKLDVDATMAELKQQISIAKSEARTRGVFMDPKAFRRLERRLDDAKVASHGLQAQLTALNAEQKSKAAKPGAREEWARRFVHKAKEILGAETFQDVVDALEDEDDLAGSEQETG